MVIMTAKSKRAAEPRRANKPLMEKRRRARINQSLAALKTLILDSAKADNTKHSKLEKADILELTVRHFQRHRSLDVKGVNQYKAGYSDCVREVQRYLDTPDAQTMTIIDAGIRQRLLRHLDNCVSEVDMDTRNSSSASNTSPTASLAVIDNDRLQPPDSSTLDVSEVNNNIHQRVIETLPAAAAAAAAIKDIEISAAAAAAAAQVQAGMMGVVASSGHHQSKLVNVNKNYADAGNFVLLLPEHYLQLANALGVNLRQPNDASGSSGCVMEKAEVIDAAAEESGVVEQRMGEKPLDFSSKNNSNEEVEEEEENCADNMWRPW